MTTLTNCTKPATSVAKCLFSFPYLSHLYSQDFPIQLAQLVCLLIPNSCPFARTLKLFGYSLSIPPLCKLNPFYQELMNLRWQALTFLVNSGAESFN